MGSPAATTRGQPEDAEWICGGIAQHFSNVGNDEVVGFVSSGGPGSLMYDQHRLGTLLDVRPCQGVMARKSDWITGKSGEQGHRTPAGGGPDHHERGRGVRYGREHHKAHAAALLPDHGPADGAEGAALR
jgi:hypothetical protein